MNKEKGQGDINPAPINSVLVLGLGNILLSDEGIGVKIVEEMQAQGYPENIEVLDGGTGSLDLLDILAGRDRVIIIDAVKGGSEPGVVYRFAPDEINADNLLPLSMHQIDMADVLSIARFTGDMPDSLIIFGIEPKSLDWGLELSPEVAAVIPRVIELVNRELNLPSS